MSKIKSVYVVVTTINDGERELYADIVLITSDKTKAASVNMSLYRLKTSTDKEIVAQVQRTLQRQGIDYTHLSYYDNVAFYPRIIDGNF